MKRPAWIITTVALSLGFLAVGAGEDRAVAHAAPETVAADFGGASREATSPEGADAGSALQKKPSKGETSCGTGYKRSGDACGGGTNVCGPCCCPSGSRCAGTTCVKIVRKPKPAEPQPPEPDGDGGGGVK